MAVAAVFSYIVGSLNSAIIMVYLLKRKDIREYGSKNAGLTNVYRCFGAGCAAATFIMDLAKGFIVVFGTKYFLFGTGLFSSAEHDVITTCYIVSLFAVLGHVFPAFYKFKGGKGILVAAMCSLAINPIVFLCGFIILPSLTAITGYVSVGSIACCIGYPAFVYLSELLTSGVTEATAVHALIGGAMGLLCIMRHIPNIKRLINHTENKFTFKKEKGEK